jgi:hypothetical protein
LLKASAVVMSPCIFEMNIANIQEYVEGFLKNTPRLTFMYVLNESQKLILGKRGDTLVTARNHPMPVEFPRGAHLDGPQDFRNEAFRTGVRVKDADGEEEILFAAPILSTEPNPSTLGYVLLGWSAR